MTLRKTILTAAAATAMVPISACGFSDSSGGSSQTVAYSNPVASQPAQHVLNNAFEAAAHSLGWDAKIYDANLSPDTQVSNIQTMIQTQADAIAVWTLDAGAMGGVYAQAKEQSIPIIGVNSDDEGITTTVWWESFMCEAPDAPFKRAAQSVAKERPGAKVIVLGGPPAPSVQKNASCFTEAAEDAGLEIINRTDNVKDDSANALALTSDLLAKYPDVDFIWAYNDLTALGASSAVTAAGLKVSDGQSPGVIIHGTNGDADAIQAIREGRLTGTWDPNNVASGMSIIKAVQNIQEGNTDDLIIKSTFWDTSNIDNYVDSDKVTYDLDDLPLVAR